MRNIMILSVLSFGLLPVAAHAEFGFDDGIRKPQSLMVAGNSVIDSNDEEAVRAEKIRKAEETIKAHKAAEAEKAAKAEESKKAAEDKSVEAEESDAQAAETAKTEEIRDDAHDLMNPKTTAPVTPDIDPFQPAPQPETPQNIKRVLKKIPAAKSQRSIADDRIDDSYVQDMMEKNFSFTSTTDIDKQ